VASANGGNGCSQAHLARTGPARLRGPPAGRSGGDRRNRARSMGSPNRSGNEGSLAREGRVPLLGVEVNPKSGIPAGERPRSNLRVSTEGRTATSRRGAQAGRFSRNRQSGRAQKKTGAGASVVTRPPSTAPGSLGSPAPCNCRSGSGGRTRCSLAAAIRVVETEAPIHPCTDQEILLPVRTRPERRDSKDAMQ
jgi:hypothetical protein